MRKLPGSHIITISTKLTVKDMLAIEKKYRGTPYQQETWSAYLRRLIRNDTTTSPSHTHGHHQE